VKIQESSILKLKVLDYERQLNEIMMSLDQKEQAISLMRAEDEERQKHFETQLMLPPPVYESLEEDEQEDETITKVMRDIQDYQALENERQDEERREVENSLKVL
jgi:hypothetical protein